MRILCIFFMVVTAFGCGDNLDVLSIKDNKISSLEKQLSEKEQAERLKDDKITKLDNKIKELEKKGDSTAITELNKKLEVQEKLLKAKDESLIDKPRNLENEKISHRFWKLYINDVNDLSKKITAKLKLTDEDKLLKILSIYFFNNLNFQIRKIKNKHLSKEEKYHDLVDKKLSDFDDTIRREYVKDVIYANVKKDLNIDLNSINNDIIDYMLKALNSCLELVIDMSNAKPLLEFLIPAPDDEFNSTFDDSDNTIYIKSVRMAGIKDEYTVYRRAKVSVTFSNAE